MYTGEEIEGILAELGVTHAVWVPDSAIGCWEPALELSARVRLVRVCREGEAWPLAAGLFLGGKLPIVLMQTTGLFESGDALRNVWFDLKLPVYALIGVRNWLVPSSHDSAKRYAEPIIRAWNVSRVWVEHPHDKTKLANHFRQCRESAIPGMTLLAEGAP